MNQRLSFSEAAPAVYKAMLARRVGIALLAILALGNQPAKPQARNSFDGFALVDKSGNIEKPADYRDLYQTLGTYFVLDPKVGNQMHLTYASPGAAQQGIRRRHGSGEGSLRN